MSQHATNVTKHTARDAATTPLLPAAATSRRRPVSCDECAALLLIVREPCVVSSGAVLWIAILWLASLTLGQLCRGARLLLLLGSLVAGPVLRDSADVFDLPPRFGALIECVGLCVIPLMSSTDIDVNAVAPAGGITLRPAFLRVLVKAAACAGAAHWLFDMPPASALSLGFLLAAVSPLIVMPGMARLQRAGFGVAQGIPPIATAACAMDNVVAITRYTLWSGRSAPSSTARVRSASGRRRAASATPRSLRHAFVPTCGSARRWRSSWRSSSHVAASGLAFRAADPWRECPSPAARRA